MNHKIPLLYVKLLLLFWSISCFNRSLIGVPEDHIRSLIETYIPLHGKSLSLELIGGGLTNQNYKATIGNVSYFIRCAEANNILIGSSIDQEWLCSCLTSEARLTPYPLYYISAERMIISEFIDSDGNDVDLKNPKMLQRTVVLIQQLHNLDITFSVYSSPFEIIDLYLTNCQKLNLQLPADIYETVIPCIRSIREAFPEYSNVENYVPCHLDLHHGNIINEGKRLWMIDWEYAAMSDPYFDLAILSSTENFNSDEMLMMLTYYLDGRSPNKNELEHLIHMRILADARWPLWSYLQLEQSSLDEPFEMFGEAYLKECLRYCKMCD